MVMSIAIHGTEVWQMGKAQVPIEKEINEIYRRILGVRSSACTNAVLQELGVSSQKLRADATALKFRNYIMGLPQSRLLKRIYDALASETCTVRKGYLDNSVVRYLHPLAVKAGLVGLVNKYQIDDLVRQFRQSQQDSLFYKDARSLSSLIESKLGSLTSLNNGQLPAYLHSGCLANKRSGRCLKTQFRLGCHELRCSSHWQCKKRDASAKNRLCCGDRSLESVEHVICYNRA